METYEAFGGNVGAGKTTSLVSRVGNQPGRAVLEENKVSCMSLARFAGTKLLAGPKLTMWLRRLAAPRPVGPMPMTRTSTLLQPIR